MLHGPRIGRFFVIAGVAVAARMSITHADGWPSLISIIIIFRCVLRFAVACIAAQSHVALLQTRHSMARERERESHVAQLHPFMSLP